MQPRFPVRALVAGLLAFLVAAAIGVAAYNVGFSHGFVDAGRAVTLPADGGATTVYVWPGPWHGGFPFFPLVALVLAFVVVRGLLWRGRWNGPGRCGHHGESRARTD